MDNQQLTARQQFIVRHEAEIALKKHNKYLEAVRKQKIRHEKGVLKYNKKHGIIVPDLGSLGF